MRKIWLLLMLLSAGSINAGNILLNHDFTTAGDPMKSWQFAATIRSCFSCAYQGKETGMEIESSTPESSGFLFQAVKVKPDRNYELRVTFRLLRGRALFWILGLQPNYRPIADFKHSRYFTSFAGNPLVPEFVRKEVVPGSTDSSGWQTAGLPFATGKPVAGKPELAMVRVSVGLYFSPGVIQFKKIELIEK